MPAAVLAVAELLFAIGAPLGLVNAVVFAAPFLGSAALSIGLSLATSVLLRLGSQPAQPTSVKPSDGQQQIKQAVPPRWKSYGTVRLTGPVAWLDAETAQGQLYLLVLLNHGRISRFVSYHLDDAQVTIDGSGNVTTAPYSGVTTRILTRLGAPVETKYSEINTAFAVDNVRGDGIASMLLIADNFATAEDQLKNYPNGVPRFRATVDASVVWDPRDARQSRTDPSTWTFSENPVVCLLDFMRAAEGFGIPWEAFAGNLDGWNAAADICDEKVLSIAAGGYEARYRVALTYLFTDKPATVLSRFLSACDGRLWQKRDGSIGISVGKFTAPEVVLGARHILSYELTRGQDLVAGIEGVRAQYMSPAHDYREQDADPWPDGATVMALDEERVATVDLLAVPSHSQARRLMKRAYLRQRSAWRGTVRTNLAGLRVIDERFVHIDLSDELGFSLDFEIVHFEFDPGSGQCTIEVVAIGSEIDAWDPATEEGMPAGQPVLTAFSEDFDTLSGTFEAGYSLRQVIAGTRIVAAGNQVRLKFQAWPTALNPFRLDHVSIMHRSGGTANGSEAPIQITFAGAPGFSLPAGQEITSDWVDFAIAPGVDCLVVTDFTNTAPTSNRAPAAAGDGYYFLSGAASWNQQTVAGYSFSGGFTLGLARIETRAGA